MDSTTIETNGGIDADDEFETKTERRLRLRVLLAEYRTVLVIGFVLLLAFGGWVSYGVYATPNETTEQQVTDAWSSTGEFTHGATVTEATQVYDEGTELENEPLYYTAVTPSFDGTFTGGYESEIGTDVRVQLTVDLVYRAVDPDGETVYWSERSQLTETTEEDVDPGEDVTAAFTVDVTEIETAIEEIEDELGASPGQTERLLVVEREIDGSIDGEARSVSDRYQIPIVTTGATYEIEADGEYDESHETVGTETVPASVGPVRSVGGPVLLVLGVTGLVGLGLASRRWPEPTAADREWLAYRDDRDQFSAVITTVRLPDSRLEGPQGDVDRLASLAEFAIDVGAPVVYEPRTGLYVVHHDEVRYVFEPPALETAGDGAEPETEGEGTDPETDGAEPHGDEDGPNSEDDGIETASKEDETDDNSPGEFVFST